ncbi:MAG: ferric reductase-like transmembrane domain-containing protein [Minisyncoccia bacterium]
MHSYKKYFKAFIYLQLLVLGVSLFFYDYDLKLAGAFSGKFSIWVFWIVAVPGILQRFRVKNRLQKIQLFLMKYRRYLGIIVFNFAFIHFMWMRGLDILTTGLPSTIPTYQVFGAIALVLLTPLFLTSNNYSVKKLGKFWKTLHTLVYPTMFLLVLHTAFQGLDYALIYGLPSAIILIIQIYSHIYAAKIKKAK